MTDDVTPRRRGRPPKATTAAPIRETVSCGIPAGRLLELAQETLLPQPYVVTDEIVIAPPTKARADKAREAQMTIVVYNTLLNEALKSSASEDVLTGITKQIKEAERLYNEAFFGDIYDDLIAFFNTQDDRLWAAFSEDIQKWFFPNQPKDGKCPHCGSVVDEDTAGKAPAS